MVRLHRRDHVVDGAAMERMHGRGPGAVDVAKLRIARCEIEHAPVLETERHLVSLDLRDLCRLAVNEPETGVVARPADAVARPKLHVLHPVDLDPAASRGEPSRLPGDRSAVLAFEIHRVPPVIHPGDAELVALFDAEALVGAVERDHVAGPVVGRQRLLGTGVAARDQALGVDGRAADRAVADQPFPDDFVDPLAQRVARRHQPGVRAFFGRECEPARRRGAGEIVRLHLGDVVPELPEPARDVAREARLDRFLQGRIALAHDLVHHRGLHAGALKLREGLAGIDRVELLLVADEHHAGDAERIGDPEQVPGLDGGGERALVDDEGGLRERAAHLVGALPRHAPFGDARVAREEALQGLARDPRLGFEGARRRGRGREARIS